MNTTVKNFIYANAQVHDLGVAAYTTLKWDHFAGADPNSAPEFTIGLTTDKKMYVAGNNQTFCISTKTSPFGAPPFPANQATFKYVPSPAGETVKKVDVMQITFSLDGTVNYALSPGFGCLTESGKLYVWGANNGLFTNAFPIAVPSSTDSTKTRRAPVQLSIPGETSIVDFDMPNTSPSHQGILNYWSVVGESGKAYIIGKVSGIFAAADYSTSFYAIKNPAGVDATFKYVKVWVGDNNSLLYLKGNDGNIYFAGITDEYSNNSGVPSLFQYRTSTGFLTDNNGVTITQPVGFSFRTMSPFLVPFPAGEDIVKIDTRLRSNTLALSASGKAYGTGIWKYRTANGNYYPLVNGNHYRFPLKNVPVVSTELHKYAIANSGTPLDTTYVLKKFVELAIPPSANKVIEISSLTSTQYGETFMIVGDNKKAYWSGTTASANYEGTNPFDFTVDCRGVEYKTQKPYEWEVYSPHYDNVSKIFPMGISSAYLISSSNTGYFVGLFRDGSAAAGRHYSPGGTNGEVDSRVPRPFGNELLDACNTNPGTGGTGNSTAQAVGVIDCSKTQIAPAPVAGVPSQLSLIVSVNVTTAGTFTPITVSGSGMSLGNGVSSISTTTTGVQTFYIPLQYDGSALTNAFQFTVGSAGSCTADLTQKPNKQVTNVWSLTNCSAITPGVLSK